MGYVTGARAVRSVRTGRRPRSPRTGLLAQAIRQTDRRGDVDTHFSAGSSFVAVRYGSSRFSSRVRTSNRVTGKKSRHERWSDLGRTAERDHKFRTRRAGDVEIESRCAVKNPLRKDDPMGSPSSGSHRVANRHSAYPFAPVHRTGLVPFVEKLTVTNSVTSSDSTDRKVVLPVTRAFTRERPRGRLSTGPRSTEPASTSRARRDGGARGRRRR